MIMGLGVNGSGIASARYAAQHGAITRVTDLRPPNCWHPAYARWQACLSNMCLGSIATKIFYGPKL